ncbi:hypothetical protein ALGA_3317 [Labilibaculum antarcticum]|uniref:Uncharacterized protein n=1 Tax=Labilibaculum antarcticum TaxID=1717717 RepID=A0A1Y1CMI1_9BACT|nr:hypothetical protein ALGA_3317 [Labilibaculum antarcticum]
MLVDRLFEVNMNNLLVVKQPVSALKIKKVVYYSESRDRKGASKAVECFFRGLSLYILKFVH